MLCFILLRRSAQIALATVHDYHKPKRSDCEAEREVGGLGRGGLLVANGPVKSKQAKETERRQMKEWCHDTYIDSFP